MNWTRSRPTEPGWYWLGSGRYCVIAEVWARFSSQGRELIVRCGGEPMLPLDCLETDGWWMGPLPVPDPPKEGE